MPISAAGNVPTGVNTLKRPPTLGGMSSAGTLRRSANGRSAPCLGSVTKTRCCTISSFADVIRAIRTHNAYANLHTTMFPGGEVRGPVEAHNEDDE